MPTQLVQAEGEPEVFVIIEEKKCWVQTGETVEKKNWDLTKRQIISLVELNKWPTGETILWKDGYFIVGDKPRDIYFPDRSYKCRAWLGHQQVIQYNVETKVELDKISYDSEGCFDTITHSYQVKEDGDYLIIGVMWYDWGAKDGNIFIVKVLKNDTEILMERIDQCSSSGSKDIQPHAVDILPLKKNDKISLWTWGNWGGGGPFELKVFERMIYLTIRRMGN